MPEHESNNSRSASDSETYNTGKFELKITPDLVVLLNPPNRFS